MFFPLPSSLPWQPSSGPCPLRALGDLLSVLPPSRASRPSVGPAAFAPFATFCRLCPPSRPWRPSVGPALFAPFATFCRPLPCLWRRDAALVLVVGDAVGFAHRLRGRLAKARCFDKRLDRAILDRYMRHTFAHHLGVSRAGNADGSRRTEGDHLETKSWRARSTNHVSEMSRLTAMMAAGCASSAVPAPCCLAREDDNSNEDSSFPPHGWDDDCAPRPGADGRKLQHEAREPNSIHGKDARTRGAR